MPDFCGPVYVADDEHKEPFDTLAAALNYAATCEDGKKLKVVAADTGDEAPVEELLSCLPELMLSWPR